MKRLPSLFKVRPHLKPHVSYKTTFPTLRGFLPCTPTIQKCAHFPSIRFFSSSTKTIPTSTQKSVSVSNNDLEQTMANFKSMLSKLDLSVDKTGVKAMITPLFNMVADTAENQDHIQQVQKLLTEFITLLKQANLNDLTPLVAAYRGLGVVYLNAKDCKAAEEHLELAAEYCRKAIQSGDHKAKTQAVEIECLKLMVYDEQCEYKKAVDVFREIIGRLNELPNDEVPRNLAAAYCKFAERPQEEGFDEVAQLMEKGIEIIKEKFGQDNVELVNCYRSIAVLSASKEDFTKVSEYLENCLRVCEKNYNGERLEVELAINDILRGNLYCATPENKSWIKNNVWRGPVKPDFGASSLPYFKQGVSVLENSSGYPREILAGANLSLAVLYQFSNKAHPRQVYNKAVDIIKAEKGENSQELADIYFVWGEICDYSDSFHCLHEAIRIYQEEEEEKNALKIDKVLYNIELNRCQGDEFTWTSDKYYEDLRERTRDKPKRMVISAWNGTYFLSRRYAKFKIY